MPANLRNDLMNNYLKLTKFAVQSYLSGVDKMKIGFVSRSNIKDKENHIINGFLDIDTDQILNLTNFNKLNAWGILKNIVDIINKQNDGTFILMKSLASQKPIIKLLKLPVEANIDEEDEEF
jgi:translation initiation factor 3 subunit D